ncbi:hypothetical protein R1flu_016861 [Riccia fluitans]|uniref:Uncharacterized protein n=1 Tax=Riccia fluitans TaxID=41844 RepID=A0ABD1YNE9_9MARC
MPGYQLQKKKTSGSNPRVFISRVSTVSAERSHERTEAPVSEINGVAERVILDTASLRAVLREAEKFEEAAAEMNKISRATMPARSNLSKVVRTRSFSTSMSDVCTETRSTILYEANRRFVTLRRQYFDLHVTHVAVSSVRREESL